MRLHRFIARSGRASRRRAEDLIREGRVRVNGAVVDRPGSTVRPGEDEVTVDGERLALPAPLTIAFHKPPGCITTRRDPRGRPTVLDHLPRELIERGLLPAGRLDQDTEGLLVLTNDGDLIQRLTHPSHEVEKEYVARVDRRPAPDALRRLGEGVVVEGRRTAPAQVLGVEDVEGGAEVRLAIHEGRKRQVRHMLRAVGHEVRALRRVRIGGLELGDLARGAWRELGDEEIARLERTAPERGRRGAARRRG